MRQHLNLCTGFNIESSLDFYLEATFDRQGPEAIFSFETIADYRESLRSSLFPLHSA